MSPFRLLLRWRADASTFAVTVALLHSCLQAAKAKDEILLVNVRGVDLPAKLHRGAMYVFEVRFSGKSSPWVLSASTQVRGCACMRHVPVREMLCRVAMSEQDRNFGISRNLYVRGG